MKKNKYVCGCGHSIITVDLYTGVTPASILCNKCNGDMWSRFYDVDQELDGDMFWIKPRYEKLKDQVKWEIEFYGAQDILTVQDSIESQKTHIDKGGLVLCPSLDKYNEWRFDADQ